MGDTSNLYMSYEYAKELHEKKNYLMAAVEAYWCLKYCSEGEPYRIGDIHHYESVASEIYDNSKKKLIKPVLSKTQYINGCQCLKYLWLYHKRYRHKQVSEETQRKFKTGHIVGKLAQHLFPNGKDATPFKGYCERSIDMARCFLPTFLKQLLMIENTTLLIDENIIYEASFVHELAYAAVDILVKDGNKRIAYEVKSSAEITNTLIKDCTFQYYVISNNIKLDDFYLVYVNDEYVKELNIPLQDLTTSNCDVNKLFIKESVIDRVLVLQEEVCENVKKFKEVLAGDEPNIKQGEQCNIPYNCAFNDYCYKQEHPRAYDKLGFC